ncbi:hypothetical protein HU200_017026 [Digitaria exilis]|uniref:C2H2-type domain-containing protein n=1 Tax=Digitaria exilis TaxID=1010633 RepID=A0A835F7F2_9POAL|nr:hypothetical protein HU200_017026 [Digitaria exilis]CAB3477294.1 unnamed protein product [Digitaria exilis]
MDFELRHAREKLEREQRERMQRAKAKADRERRAKAEASRRREALEASHRERRLDAARAQEEADQKMEEVMQLGKGVSFVHMFEALRYDGPGDKIKLPPSSFKELSDEGALDKGPMYFRLSKVRDTVPGTSMEQDTEEATCCGVLEFTAREGSAELPLHVWNNLFRNDTPDVPLIEVRYVSLPKGTYAKLKPEGAGFSDLPNHRAVLETALRNHATLSKNDVVVVNYGQLQYKLKVLELKPESSVSVLETDVEVDIEGSDSILDNEENQHVLVPLAIGKVESSVVEEGKFRYYKFSVEESASEKIASGRANIEVKLDTDASGGDTDIYVSRHPLVFPTQHRHEWSSHEMGSKVLILKPKDSSLVSGLYSIGVYGFKGTSKYQLSVAIKDVNGQRIGEHACALGSVDIDSVLCRNCKRHIASRSAHLHEAYCMRHNVACPHDGCGVVLRKEEAADHVHCNKCGRAFQQREMEKHMKVFHEPLQCPCGVILEKEDMVQHQSSTCPLRLIVCRFCGDTVQAGGEPIDARDRLRNMCEHESICGSRTAPCDSCGRSVMLKEMDIHHIAVHQKS